MIYLTHYKSPVGDILLASKDNKLIGLWFKGQKYFLANINEEIIESKNIKILNKAKIWLDKYFKGEKPNTNELKLDPLGSDFRKEVWKILITIPYGKVVTYNDIAKALSKKKNKRISARAVGGAVGHNPISIIIPCHRVIGSNGNLTGYAGGLKIKKFLLEHENTNKGKGDLV